MDADRIKNAEILKKQLEEQARFQEQLNGSLEDYLKGVESVRAIKQSILTAEKNIEKVQEEINQLSSSTLQEDIERAQVLKDTKKLLEIELGLIKKQHKEMSKIVKETKTWKMFTAEAIHGTGKMLSNISKIPGKFNDLMSPLKDLFEMDKSIRSASLQMGLIGSQSDAFRKNIKLAAEDTQRLGVGIKELAEMQAQYSENIGRNVSLGKQDLIALSEIAQGTALGAEATAQMAADFEAQGISATRTRDAMEEAANRASSMGLNSAKVVKNIAQNTKMLNRFRFKDGVKGLVKMSELSARLGVDMEFASGFAEKLFNVEGAVETAAQLNVMGGAFARLGDPFKLMYMARNDIAGLTEELAKAASESATFNKQTGKFELGAMEMHRLRIIAEQTGLSYEELATAGQNAAKFSKIKSQVSFDMDEDSRKFLENTAQFDENGKAYITVDGEKKFLSMLGASGKNLIKRQVEEKKRLEERAKAALTFDEQITNLINMVKTFMLPIVEGITDVLKPFVEDLMNNDKFMGELKSLGENIGSLVKEGAGWVKWFAELAVALGPKGIFKAWVTGKAVLFLFDAIKWFANGVALGRGFLKTTGGTGGGGSFGSGFKGMRTGVNMMRSGRVLSGAGTLFKGAGKAAFPLALAGVGIDAYQNLTDENLTTGEGIGKTLDENKFMALGAGIGAMFGGVGAIPGAGIGALVDLLVNSTAGEKGLVGNYIGDGYGVNDGLFKGSGNDRRAILQKGRITPIDNKDDVLAMKPNGIVDKMMNQRKVGSEALTKIEFDEIKITGEIKIMLPDGTNIGRELMKNPEFKTSITRVVTSQLDKNVNGGKNKP